MNRHALTLLTGGLRAGRALAGVDYELFRLFAIEAAAGPIAEGVRFDVAEAGGRVVVERVVDGRTVSLCRLWSGDYYARARGYFPLAADECELVLLETDAAARGRGYAVELLRAVPAVLAELGMRRAYGRVWHSYRPSAKAFARAGWPEIGVRLDVKRGGWSRAINFGAR